MPLIDWKAPSKFRSKNATEMKCTISPANLQTDIITNSVNQKNVSGTLADLNGFTNLENLPAPQNPPLTGGISPCTSGSSVSPPPLPPRNRGRRCRAGATPPSTRSEKTFTAPLQILPPVQLVFHCQFAHGGPTGLLSGFHTVKELYNKIANCYDIHSDEILFCTLNSHKIDMNRLLGGQLGLEDFIFVHLKGQRKEVEIMKTNVALGLTITDNGAGKCFIKRIKPGSLVSQIEPAVKVGDHIEKLNGELMVGKRHMTVAKALRDLSTHSTFTLRLIEPLQGGFSFIAPRSTGGRRGPTTGNGKQTLRFKATGPAVVVQAVDDLLVERLNHVLDTYMGISDKDLAMTIYDLGRELQNPIEFTQIIAQSELGEFHIPEDVVFDLWGVINDWRRGTLQPLCNQSDTMSDVASTASLSGDSSIDSHD